MGKTYLFSPVGNTDPIKYFYDGSMLHICRKYKPDIVYLYLSREMVKNHRKDNRYAQTIELLGKWLNHTFEVRLIMREDLVEVQQYDVFYKEFREMIAQIEKEMEPGDRLLLNMASGTPAMKSALVVMATLAEYRFIPVQVSTPKRESNLEHEERKEYDVEFNWELNEDNKENFVDRCREVQCFNLMRLLKLDMIKKHLLAYDYHAAYAIGKELEEEISPETLKLLRAAEARVNLDTGAVSRNVEDNVPEFYPVRDGNKRKLFEYALGLDIKLKKGEYADFVRAITPLGVDLLEMLLKQYCNINLKDYCQDDARAGDKNRQNKQGSGGKKKEAVQVKKWDNDKLQDTAVLKILQEESNLSRFDVVYSWQLNKLIQRTCPDKSLAENTEKLVQIESKVRNVAAHDIVSVTEEWIKKQTEMTPGKIMELIQHLCKMAKITTDDTRWNSYQDMNRLIIQALEREGTKVP